MSVHKTLWQIIHRDLNDNHFKEKKSELQIIDHLKNAASFWKGLSIDRMTKDATCDQVMKKTERYLFVEMKIQTIDSMIVSSLCTCVHQR